MASSRAARFATEVAPPQFVSVVRRRASKAMDTIHEDDREQPKSSSDNLQPPSLRSFTAPISSYGTSSSSSSRTAMSSSSPLSHFNENKRGFPIFGFWSSFGSFQGWVVFFYRLVLSISLFLFLVKGRPRNSGYYICL